VVHARKGGPVAIPAQVQLDEGPWLSATLHLADPASQTDPASPAAEHLETSLAGLARLHAGMAVTAEFVSPPAGESYPLFRPVGSHG
jgi:hypothetical protein